MNIQEITVAATSQTDLRQTLLVDVRTQGEFADKRIALPVALAPLDTLDPENFALQHGILHDTPIIFICVSGSRAHRGAEKFAQQGFTNLKVLQGGLSAWEQAGLPLISKQANIAPGPIPLERQVRIAAGSLVCLFILLGYLIHPYFSLGALFVGCGLVYAGITNQCGMALLLMYAPWNRSGSCTSSSCAIGARPHGNAGGGCQ